MKVLISFILSLFLVGQGFANDPASDMATAANHLLDSLDSDKRNKALFAWADKERENWHFFPGTFIKPNGRMGLSFKDMNSAQRTLAHTLLGSALSHRGHIEASTIILLEQILFEKEGKEMRNPDLYHIAIFGQPDHAGTWGWRFGRF